MESGEPGTRMPYGELLRTLGERLDARDWGGLRLDAQVSHLVLEARPSGRGAAARLAFTPATMRTLLREAHAQRGAASSTSEPRPHPAGLGYREALRLIGQDLDRRGVRLTRVLEHDDGLIVQSFPPGAGLTTVLVSWPHLVARHRQALRQRRPWARESA